MVIVPSNSIPGALWLKLNSAIKIIKIFKNLEKIENVKIFKIFENFRKFCSRRNLTHRALGMELEGAITTVGKDFVHTFES